MDEATIPVGLRLRPSTIKLVDAAAKRDGRSRQNFTDRLLRRATDPQIAAQIIELIARSFHDSVKRMDHTQAEIDRLRMHTAKWTLNTLLGDAGVEAACEIVRAKGVKIPTLHTDDAG